MAQLRIEAGKDAGRVYPLEKEVVVLGRHATCDIVVDASSVSRQHAAITESQGKFTLEDLRSRNRTFLNGEPVFGPVTLEDRDEIRIAEIRLSFRGDGEKKLRRSDPTLFKLDEDDGVGGPAIESSSVAKMSHAEGGDAADPQRKLEAVLQIGRELAECVDVDSVLERAVGGLLTLFPNAARAIALWEEGEGTIRVRRWRDAGSAPDPEAVPQVSRTVIRQARESDDAVLLTDVESDVRFDQADSLHDLQLVSVMCVPLRSGDGERYGFLEIDAGEDRAVFTAADLDTLVGVAAQIGVAVRGAILTEQMLAQRDVRRDLEFAMQVQLGFLPNEPPTPPGYEFFDHYEAARQVGGDYFDYITLPDGRIAMTIGDVAGKGMPAALLMARLFASARYQLLTHKDPAEALGALNREITNSRLGHRFITCLFAIVDTKRHTLSVINAGHPSLVVRDAKRKIEIFPEKCRGMPIGIAAEQTFETHVRKLAVGDAAVAFTDGVTEAMNRAQELFGVPRVGTFMADGPDAIGPLVSGLVDAIETFAEGVGQKDDICVVGFRRL